MTPTKYDSMADYWDWRYRKGNHSGHVDLTLEELTAALKARALHINSFVEAHDVRSVLDIGSGDGMQAQYLTIPDYLGVEISRQAIWLAEQKTDKPFIVLNPEILPRDLHLSLDVIQHQTHDSDYDAHMELLFSANRYAIVNAPSKLPLTKSAPHIRFRVWMADVPADWSIIAKVDDLSFWERV